MIGAIGHAVIRFGRTFLRQEPLLIWGLPEAQVIALVTGLLGLTVLVARLAWPASPLPTAVG